MKRDVWFVRLGFRPEGLRYPRGHYQQSLVVDAESLGPRCRQRSISRADRRAFKAALRAAKEHWRAWGQNCAPVELYHSRLGKLLDRFTGGPLIDSARVILESETEIVRLIKGRDEIVGLDPSLYARETILYPTVPNRVTPHDLGAGKVVIAYGKIAASYQALMGMPRWACRAWYQDLTVGDEKTHIDGHSPLPSYVGVVHYGHHAHLLNPGIPSRPFDPSTLQPLEKGFGYSRKKDLLEQYG